MADNLEDFLRQAAQRRQQRAAGQNPQQQQPRQQPGQQPSRQQPPRQQPSSQPVRQVERTRQIVEAEVVELADEGESVTRRITSPSPITQPHNVSTIGPAVTPSREIDTADERMARHVQDFLVHPVSNLSQETVSAKDSIAAEIIQAATVSEITSSTNTQVRKQINHPLVAMLRRPETLKAAFIAGEIFKTKF
jgi:hypothetical protein